ncbi:MAG TPA: MoxR family ATPase [bacterium]|jgi:MoxR-like ATPase
MTQNIESDIKQQDVEKFKEDYERITKEVHKVIVGQEEVVKGTLIAIFADGHALLEGVPGLGKTLLISTLSKVLDLTFRRIQFTPDLMPADIVGTNIIMERQDGSKYFEFQKGPVFTNILLADEINRATPKTQSALLEAMQERQITAAGATRKLEAPFFTLATQNPLEMEGTYPLPEAQLDRFMFKIMVEFPPADDLAEILIRTTGTHEADPQKVIDGPRILEMKKLVRKVPIATHVIKYAVRLANATHPEFEDSPSIVRKYGRYGSSPRGAQTMVLAAKVEALLNGRYNVAFDDVRKVALPGLRHRCILNFEGEAEGIVTDDLIAACIKDVPVKEAGVVV